MVSYGILIFSIIGAAIFGVSIGLYISVFKVDYDDESEDDEE